MPMPPTGAVVWIAVVGWILVVLLALRFRSRAYAIFRGVMLAITGATAIGMYRLLTPDYPMIAWPYLYLMICVHVQSLRLVWPDMRPLWYRVMVSIPEGFFQASILGAVPWAVAYAFGAKWAFGWAPFALGLVGVVQALSRRREAIDVVVGDGHVEGPVRRFRLGEKRVARPLRLVQLTDTHLGPWMSVERLRGYAERAVAAQPDLVFLTGDFLTMESQADSKLLSTAFAPFRDLPGRVYACFGNHDLEAPQTVRRALAELGIRLLVDQAEVVETEAGCVQIIGADFKWRGRAEHLAALCAAHPRLDGSLRLLMLHDPSAFTHVPAGEADLVLSGHTHGGQVGLVSLGLNPTVVSVFGRTPDHGFFAHGDNRMYVHRGTGHYGFPLRLGVPAEESVMSVHR